VGIGFSEGAVQYDESGDPISGSGTIIYVDIQIPLAADPDHALIPVGTYTMDADGDYAAGTWSAEDSYITKLVDGEIVYAYASFSEGTMTVSKAGDNYKFVLSMTVEGEKLQYEYTGPAKLVNSSDDGQFSNLDRDVEVKSLTQASMFLIGDIMEDGATETWAISIGDEHYDLLTDWGLGYSILLYFNLEPGLDAVPAGTYDKFMDVTDLMTGAAAMEPNTLLAGFSSMGLFMGCYYMCPALTEEAALRNGSVTVVANGGRGYTITGKLLDGFGNEVSFKYEGDVIPMYYDDSTVRSASTGIKGLISKKPAAFKMKK
jgi:hypothetical protein